MKTAWIGVCWLIALQLAVAQTHQEKLKREFAFEKKGANNTLVVANINGSVKVSVYSGDKILVEVDKTIKAKTEARLEKGKQELALGIIDLADTLILFVDGLCSAYKRNPSRSENRIRSGWGYDWNSCNEDKSWRKDEGYDYEFTFIIQVPAGINLSVSTVNNGDIKVEDVTGSVKANNVNGSIYLHNITGATLARTINGDVELNYARNPSEDCQYYTLNGNIHANFRKGLGADLSFESFNGNFYTNITKLESLPTSIEKKEKSGQLKYKLSNNRFKIGQGGVHLDFETFNGNVYLKEI